MYKTLLTKAIEYDLDGRQLEALKLYEDGISELMKVSRAEANPDNKRHYQQKIAEYMARAEEVKAAVVTRASRGEIRDKFHIVENATNYSYERIFGRYLTEEVKEILVEEPYVKEFYQICNFTMFCELAVTKCRALKCIKLSCKKDERRDSEQAKGLADLGESLRSHHVTLIVDYLESLHDRQVMLSNGYIIKIGRGLNYFKPLPSKFHLGSFNFDFRPCLQTNVDIIFSPEMVK